MYLKENLKSTQLM